jgi:hypothetical protein
MDTEKPQKKILLAVRPTDFANISEFLGAEFDFTVCTTLKEAIAHLTEDIGLILCGVRFDSGQMFELLEASRANPATRLVPYYLIVGKDTNYSYPILDGIRSAAKVKGISGFIHVSRLVFDLGREEAHEWVKHGISDILHGHAHAGKGAPSSFPDAMTGFRSAC